MTLKDILQGKKYVIKHKLRRGRPIEDDIIPEWDNYFVRDLGTSKTILTASVCYSCDEYDISIEKQKLQIDQEIAADLFHEARNLYKEQEAEKARKAEEREKAKHEKKKNAVYKQISAMLNQNAK